MKVVLAQCNPIVGNIDENLNRILHIVAQYCANADLVVFSELFLTGYPPRDLLGEPWFINRVSEAVRTLVERSDEFPGCGILVGAPTPHPVSPGAGLYNSALLISDGRLLFTQHKSLLPTYDVFDETRYFDRAPQIGVISFKGVVLGISICEDAWNDPEFWPRQVYEFDPIEALARQGAELLINISASPFTLGKETVRHRLISNHARKQKLPFVFINQVGGNDDLVFDGRSMAFDGQGNPTALFSSFREQVQVIDTVQAKPVVNPQQSDRMGSLHEALTLGVRDYMYKCGFHKAVIGLSGGIDSAIVACIAVSAIGKENVLGIAMPSIFTASISTEYAQDLAKSLGVEFRIIPILSLYDSYLSTLRDELALSPQSVELTLENLQARIRGNILMAFSNRQGSLVLSTGNKSEFATGYCTLYGDMAGGLAVISDVPKTMIYELAHYINRETEVIPREIITRPPTAELKPSQVDQDTLPAYDILDAILNHYVEEHLSPAQIVQLGFDSATVKWIIGAVNRSEYKRRQSAPGLKVTTRAFGMGRRMPIAARIRP